MRRRLPYSTEMVEVLDEWCWERIHSADTSGHDATAVRTSVWRLAIPGGWLYKTAEIDERFFHDVVEPGQKPAERQFKKVKTVSTCFVPDPSQRLSLEELRAIPKRSGERFADERY